MRELMANGYISNETGGAEFNKGLLLRVGQKDEAIQSFSWRYLTQQGYIQLDQPFYCQQTYRN